jgi:ribose-phosphate pyrophosphokinase
MLDHELKVFSGTANPMLAEAICKELDVTLGRALIGRFPDGETSLRLDEDVRGRDIFVIQPTCHPVNENLMELLILIDCLRRASASRITAVVPYYGYARMDRKDRSRVPITAKLVANLIAQAGADRVLAMDLHASQIQGFFDVPMDHLYAAPVLIDYYLGKNIPDLTLVAPDLGSVKLARAYGEAMSTDLAIVDKRRIDAQTIQTGYLIGNVQGRNVLMVEDLIATGTSVIEAARLLKSHGARDVYVAATHPVLCGNAIQRLNESELTEITVTDTIPADTSAMSDKFRVVSIAPLLAEAIDHIHHNKSVSKLFATPVRQR